LRKIGVARFLSLWMSLKAQTEIDFSVRICYNKGINQRKDLNV